MKKKNSLKSLSKLELLELLAEQEHEIQELKQQLEEKNQLIEQRTLCMKQSGNIAQAALALNGVFEAAQKAADQYVESVKEMIDKNLRQDGTFPYAVSDLGAHNQSVSQIQSVVQNPATAKTTQTATEEEVLQNLNAYEILQENTASKTPQEKPAPNEQEGEV